MRQLVSASSPSGDLTLSALSQGFAQPEGTASAGDLWRILWRRRLSIGAVTLLLLGLTLAYCLLAPPLYTSSSELLIDPRDRVVVVNDINPSTVAPDGGITQIESQARVIESSSVLLRAIQQTHLTEDTDFNGDGKWDRFVEMINLGPAKPRTEESVLETTLGSLKRRLSVKRADKVFVIEVIISARTAEKSARLANAIAEAYLADLGAARAQSGERAANALAAKLEAQHARVDEAENAIQDYKQENGIVTASGQLLGDQKLIELSTMLTSAQSRSSGLRAKIDQVDQVRRSQGAADATAEALQSPVIGKLREQESGLVQQKADLEARLGPNHPALANNRAQLNDVRRLIGAELTRIATSTRADYERALSDERLLSGQIQRIQNSANAVNQAMVGLRALERDLDARRSVYTAFLVRSQEIREQAGIDTSNARVITRAMPPSKKSWPLTGILLAGALGSGLGLGGGLALIREYARPTLLGPRQVEQAAGARVVAVLPGRAGKHAAGALPALQRTADIPGPGEDRAIGSLGLALRRMLDLHESAEEQVAVQTLVITSGAGDLSSRRRVCTLFAAAAARRGDRVLLVEAGQIGTVFSQEPGLMDVLRGDQKLAAAVQRPASSGPARLGPGRASQQDGTTLQDLSLGRRGQRENAAWRMLVEARNLFDLVIIDGGVLTDNLAVAPLLSAANEVVFVAHLARTTLHDLRVLADAAMIMGHPLSAAVLIDDRIG